MGDDLEFTGSELRPNTQCRAWNVRCRGQGSDKSATGRGLRNEPYYHCNILQERPVRFRPWLESSGVWSQAARDRSRAV